MRYLSTVIVALAIAMTGFGAEAQIEVATDSGAEPGFESSLSCAKCHLDIYNYWKESLHAQALDDHIFQAAYMLALKEKGDGIRKTCLGCHAPTTAFTDDSMEKLPITAEAVTCDFCHRISEIDISSGTAKVTLTSGDEKYGPLEPTDSEKSHPSVRSELFTDSKLCATCHQWSNAQGVPIFDTYREWLDGPYSKKGVHCQNCHMPLVEGSLVTGGARNPGKKINSHNLSGGHSIVQVASAADVRVASVTYVPGGLRAIVEVTNKGSGHMIPTGIPSRELLLEVQLVDSKGIVRETAKHIFMNVIVDKQHRELTADADIIIDGAMISKDNRIPPGETVAIPFHFAASSKTRYMVKATLSYRYTPLVLKKEEIKIEMGRDAKSPQN